MSDKNPLKKEIEKYLQVPFYMAVLLVIMNGVVYGVDTTSGIIVTVFIVAYFSVAAYMYFRKRPNIMSDLVAFSFAHGSVQSKLIKELAIPYTLVDSNGRVLWSNKAFYEIVKSDKQHMRKHIQHIFTDITLELLQMEPEDENQRVVHIYQNEKNYRVEIRRVDVQTLLTTDMADDVREDDVLFAIYLYDETKLVEALEEKEKIKLVAGHIYIDNYEEAMEATEEVRRALLVA